MDINFRCNCPITSALDILGDKWVLVIVKQMLFQGKQSFKDFTESEEAIATNILSTKLKLLIEVGVLTKSKLPDNKKSIYYHLTDKGLSLTPVLIELLLWSDEHLRSLNKSIIESPELSALKSEKHKFSNLLVLKYKKNIAEKKYQKA